jgi:hypothetical protein
MIVQRNSTLVMIARLERGSKQPPIFSFPPHLQNPTIEDEERENVATLCEKSHHLCACGQVGLRGNLVS